MGSGPLRLDGIVPTADRVRELLDYDPLTGVFHWKLWPRRRGVTAGAVAGTVDPLGYVIIMIDRRRYRAHKLAWLYVTGEWHEGELDHRENDPGDNRFAELRPATRSQQMQNTRKRSDNGSGVKGVTFHKKLGKWQAQIGKDGRCIYLGVFESFEAACAVRQKAAAELFGEFARAA